jgi:flagellar motor switch protein FliM
VAVLSDEILSQREIDDLLLELSDRDAALETSKLNQPEKNVKEYDFKRALRFSKDQIRSLTRIYDNFSRLLTTLYSAHLRAYTNFSVVSADQIPYDEYIRSIPNMTFLNVIEIPPLKGRMIMEVHPDIAYAMVDRILGGRGTGINKIAHLTDIEMKLLRNLFQRTLEPLQEAWTSIAEIRPVLREIEVNPQFLQLVSPNETVVVITMQATVGETGGMVNICIPHVVLEPVIPKLSAQYWMESGTKERTPEAIASLESNIRETDVEVTVELGTADLSIHEFLTLDAGDVFQLNKSIDAPLTVKVAGIPKFTGQPGKKNQHFAVQILSLLDEGDEDNE